MKKRLSFLLCFAVLVASVCGLSGCIFRAKNKYPYRGDYKELYTVAVYSIPNSVGYMHHGEGAYSSDIYIWEQDDYGRTLFAYCEDDGNQLYSLVVSQSYDEKNVFFYPDVNYSVTFIEAESLYNRAESTHLMERTKDFYLKDKERLKEANDWNKPLEPAKCVSYPITDHKELDPKAYSLSSVECNNILYAHTETLNLPNPNMFPHRTNRILQVDAEGKVLHEVYGVHQHYDNPNWTNSDKYTSYKITLWVITDKDGNYDKETGVLVIQSNADDSYFTYDPAAVLEFKQKNGWVNQLG